jgi:O-antigen ligase
MIIKLKNIFLDKNIILALISIYPLALIIGSAVSELLNLLIITFFFYLLFKKKILVKINIYFYFLIFFWLYLFFSFLFSVDRELSFPRFFSFLRFPLLFISILYFFSFLKNNIKIIFLSWLIIFLIAVFDLYFQFFFGKNILGFESPWPGRLSGFMHTKLKIAYLLLGFFPIILGFLIDFKFKNKIYLLTIFCLSVFIIFILINERSNALKFIFWCILFFLFQKKILVQFKNYVVIFILSLFLILVFNSTSLKQRYYFEFISLYDKDKSFMEFVYKIPYVAHYETALNIFKNYPILGSGIKTFRVECAKDTYSNLKSEYTRCSTHPHQIYFEILSELGLVGFFLFFGFFFYIFKVNISIYKNNNNSIHLASLLFLLTHFIPIIPGGSFFNSFGATIFWLNFSIMVYYQKIKSK